MKKITLKELIEVEKFGSSTFLVQFLTMIEALGWKYEAEVDSDKMVYVDFFPIRDKWDNQRYIATFYADGSLEDIDSELEVQKFEDVAFGEKDINKKEKMIKDCQTAVGSLLDYFAK